MIATLEYIFNVGILVGFLIPLVTILTGWFGGALGGGGADVDVDLDISADSSVDSGGVGGSIVPFNLKCLCFALVVFGALGRLTLNLMSTTLFAVLWLSVCFLLAALAYFGLYHLLIKRLKRSDPSALSFRDLRGRNATVTLPVSADRMGTISLLDKTGAAISFRAKIDPDLKRKMPQAIPTGEPVVITGVNMEKRLCYVSLPLNKFVRGGMEHTEQSQEK